MKYRFFFSPCVAIACTIFLSSCATVVSPRTYQTPKEFAKRNVFRGIFHVHTQYSHDSDIDLIQVYELAKKTNLDFVVITDHNSLEGKQAYQEMQMPSRPLLLFGVELTTEHGHLVLMGIDQLPPKELEPQAVVDWVKAREGFVMLAHPTSPKNPWRMLNLEGYDGLEVYNFAHDIYLQNKLSVSSKVMFLTPKSFLKSFQQNPTEGISLWREVGSEDFKSIVFATDLHVKSRTLGMTVPNSKLQMQATTVYMLGESLDEYSISRAIAKGKTYLAREAFGSAHNFRFVAYDGKRAYQIGEHLFVLMDPIIFQVDLPEKARIQLFRDGVLVFEQEAEAMHYSTSDVGRYHVEVYRGKKLWIMTNPIFID